MEIGMPVRIIEVEPQEHDAPQPYEEPVREVEEAPAESEPVPA